MPARPRPSTFSIVAADLDRNEWGVAVQSKFISVGAVVPWAEAGTGAIATQAMANIAYGPEGLALLRKKASADEVVKKLTSADGERDHRQLGVVDAKGQAASFTGSKCMEWAGHVVGEGFACQGNILLGKEVVGAMAKAMESTPGDLADRLLAALSAGQKMGGDRRGQQSAALYVVKPKGSYGKVLDRYIDLRVDDHPAPIEELKRIFGLYDMTMLEREDPATLVRLTPEVVVEVQKDLKVLGYFFGPLDGQWGSVVQQAFSKYVGTENFENKERKDDKIWPSLLRHLHQQAARAQEQHQKAQAPVFGALSAGPGKAPPSGEPTRKGPRKGAG
ncbi:MAG: DUF1028 domain-containing protein [Euryarchaeota archaeon]|nr:DUF1028 domain-containing protein [Euryarchaeota archaeon]